jgi:hypothetical protein
MIESSRVVSLAYQRLSGDSSLASLIGSRVSRDPAVPVATGVPRYPFVTLGAQSSVPLTTVGGERVKQRVTLRVSAYVSMASGQGWTMLDQITDRVDTLLDGYSGTTGGVVVGKLVLYDSADLVDEINSEFFPYRVLLYVAEAYAV